MLNLFTMAKLGIDESSGCTEVAVMGWHGRIAAYKYETQSSYIYRAETKRKKTATSRGTDKVS